MVVNDGAPMIFPHSPRKTPSNEPWMKLVGAAIPEIQLGLCRRGGKGIWFGARGTGVGAKRVSNRGLLLHALKFGHVFFITGASVATARLKAASHVSRTGN